MTVDEGSNGSSRGKRTDEQDTPKRPAAASSAARSKPGTTEPAAKSTSATADTTTATAQQPPPRVGAQRGVSGHPDNQSTEDERPPRAPGGTPIRPERPTSPRPVAGSEPEPADLAGRPATTHQSTCPDQATADDAGGSGGAGGTGVPGDGAGAGRGRAAPPGATAGTPAADVASGATDVDGGARDATSTVPGASGPRAATDGSGDTPEVATRQGTEATGEDTGVAAGERPAGAFPPGGGRGDLSEDPAPGEDEDADQVPADGASPQHGEVTGRQRLIAALWPPRASRAQFIVALLLFSLGLAAAIQVRSTSDQNPLRGARQEDLVRILDELDGRTQRLQDERRQLEEQRTELENSSDQAEEARRQTQRKADQLAVLAGTVAAEGPGITLTINDPGGQVSADMLLDALQELRAAGAEAIQINDVRVVADTFFSDGVESGGVHIDGNRVTQPYRFKVIGNPQDLEPALNIPGGVVQSFEKERATVDVVRSAKILVGALRQIKQPDHARLAPE